MRAYAHAVDAENNTMNQPFVSNQEPFEMSLLQGARVPFVPTKGATVLNYEMPEMHRGWPMSQTGPRPRKIGKIIILPDDDSSTVYGEIPLFYGGDDPDLFLGRVVKSVGRFAKKAAGTVADFSSSVADTLGKVPLIGPGLKGLYGLTYGTLIQSANNVLSGVRLDKVLSRHLESQVQNVKGVAPYVQTIISVVPGIGPGISGAISAGLTLAQGRPIEEALVDAVAGAVPGGALAKSVAKAGFAAASGKHLSDIAISALPIPPAAKGALKAGLRVASDVAQGKRVDKTFLAEANRQIDRLPPQFRKAAQIGVALGQGKKAQDIAKVYRKRRNTKRELNFELIRGPWIRDGRQIILSGVSSRPIDTSRELG
jgi:hypothetical protein